jgi:ubiquinone/menaquinone biosynthesis C-methylase UbiE
VLDHFDWLAPVYDRVMGPPDRERMQELLRLPSAGTLLDAGGGTGRVAAGLRPLVDSVVVIDLSRKMLRRAQAKGGLLPVRGVTERLPFRDESFDRVLVVDALHHFRDQRDAIRDLVRVLKPGGRLLIEEPDIHRLPVKLVAALEKLALMQSRFHPAETIREMIEAMGVPAGIDSDGGFSAWVWADKPAA